MSLVLDQDSQSIRAQMHRSAVAPVRDGSIGWSDTWDRKTTPGLAFSKLGITPSRALAERSLDQFISKVLCDLYGARNLLEVETLIVKTELRDAGVLSFLPYLRGGSGPPRNLRLHVIELSTVCWPLPSEIEVARFHAVPACHRMNDIVTLVTGPSTSQAVLHAVVAEISTRLRWPDSWKAAAVRSSFVAGIYSHSPAVVSPAAQAGPHPMTPYLWLAVYLIDASDAAAHLLISAGLVVSLRTLHDSGFWDSRFTPSLQLNSQSRHDVRRLTYLLVRVISKRASNWRPVDERVMGDLHALRERLRDECLLWTQVFNEKE